jgi:hypothetical protein
VCIASVALAMGYVGVVLAEEADPHGAASSARVDRFGIPLPRGAVARLGVSPFRHGDAAPAPGSLPDPVAINALEIGSCFALSPDGRMLASGGDHGTIRLWDLSSRSVVAALPGHEGGAGAVAFSPDGRRLASGGRWDGRLRLWDVGTAREVRAWNCASQPVSAVAWAPDGRSVATVYDYNSRILCEVRPEGDDVMPVPIQEFSQIGALAYSPDGRWLAVGTAGTPPSRLHLKDFVSGAEYKLLPDHGGRVNGIAFSCDGDIVASSAFGMPSFAWDVNAGGWLGTHGHLDRGASAIAISADGRCVASGGLDGTVRLWETATGVELMLLDGGSGDVVGVAFLPDENGLVSGHADRSSLIWDLAPPAERPDEPPGAEEMDRLWDDLARCERVPPPAKTVEGAEVYAALWRLRRAPAAVSYFHRRLKPVSAARVRDLVRALDSESFLEREGASEALAALGRDALPALIDVLISRPTAEVRNRVEMLMERDGGEAWRVTPVWLRHHRVIAVLEGIATPEARDLLERLAAEEITGTAREAAGALRRLDRRARGK